MNSRSLFSTPNNSFHQTKSRTLPGSPNISFRETPSLEDSATSTSFEGDINSSFAKTFFHSNENNTFLLNILEEKGIMKSMKIDAIPMTRKYVEMTSNELIQLLEGITDNLMEIDLLMKLIEESQLHIHCDNGNINDNNNENEIIEIVDKIDNENEMNDNENDNEIIEN